MAKKKTDYFELLEEQISYTVKAAKQLNNVLSNFDPATLERERQELHVIERQGDLKAHDIQDLLAKEFITPIDREDLAELIQEIDNVTDSLDDVLIRAYIYNIKAMRPEAMRFGELLVSSSECLARIAKEFRDFRKSTALKDEIVRLNMFEEDGDAIYTEAMAALFRSNSDPLDVIAWMNLFETLEGACDAFEHVCDLYERVMMKNM